MKRFVIRASMTGAMPLSMQAFAYCPPTNPPYLQQQCLQQERQLEEQRERQQEAGQRQQEAEHRQRQLELEQRQR
jgi:hypothetical protein